MDLKVFVAKAPTSPGVYIMKNDKNVILYVGKAKNLRNRLQSYLRGNNSTKTEHLMKHVVTIETTITLSETEALILESQLIKRHRPRYNISLRDDKSYPYIILSKSHSYPRIDIYRGARDKDHWYFGPYPSGYAAHEAKDFLQKSFKLRPCTDAFFNSRKRPCLQYQIHRCSGPCVRKISEKEYDAQVQQAIQFLKGKSQSLIDQLADAMDAASQSKAYEEAAKLRDQIQHLRQVQEKQSIERGEGDVDVLGCLMQQGIACIHLLMFRQGVLLGNRSYFPKFQFDETREDILSAFIAQHYLQSASQGIPKEIIVPEKLEEKDLLADALSEAGGHRTLIKEEVKTERSRWQQMAFLNASKALKEKLNQSEDVGARWQSLLEILGLPDETQRLECFDISHTLGELPMGSCVSVGPEGMMNDWYRRYHIKDVTPGDDYAAMSHVLTRRLTRLLAEETPLPDAIIVDGGKGQLHVAEKVLDELQLDRVRLYAIAKGEGRKPGLETLWMRGDESLSVEVSSLGFHLIQHLRDEAHRFAITGHRKARGKKRMTSTLEGIPGVGPKMRKELLRQFGGLQGVKEASVDALATVPGVGPAMAKRIHDFFRD